MRRISCLVFALLTTLTGCATSGQLSAGSRAALAAGLRQACAIAADFIASPSTTPATEVAPR